MPNTIIVDSSCLIALEGIGKLDILQKIYGDIYISHTVKEKFGLTTN